jgi:hypothetical protein
MGLSPQGPRHLWAQGLSHQQDGAALIVLPN